MPAVTTVSPPRRGRRAPVYFSCRSRGPPGPVSTTPVDAVLADARGDGDVAVGDQRHDRRAAGGEGDLAGEAVGGDHRLAGAHAGARALVDLDRRVPDRRRLADDARGHRLVPSSASLRSRPSRPWSWRFWRTASVPATAARSAVAFCVAQLVDVALGVERVAEPAGQVAHRLERAAGALLDRGDDLEDALLHAVQPAAGRLTEVDGQQQQRERHEQREGYPAPSDRLVVHGKTYSGSVRHGDSSRSGGRQRDPS